MKILFVCLANICRSPAFEAALRHLAVERGLAHQIDVDSCGLGWFHLGEHPDPRMFEAAKKRGIFIDHRAQQFQESFFERYDWILAVDEEVVAQIKAQALDEKQKQKVRLATEFSKKFHRQPIPDPYYLNPSGFDQVLDMALDCAEGILKKLKK